VSQAVRSHPETLFVVRTHPDENRPGKASRQAVADWFEASELANLSNAMLVSPEEHVSSYELIERSKFVMVYNSSVGLEASILGVPVLCAGRARYTQVDTVAFPDSANAYRQRLEDWLQADEIEVPARRRSNSRAFLYHELNHASLDLGDFLDPYPILPGMVELSDFEPAKLAESVELGVIVTGILERSPFTLEVALQMEPA
jgi:UDP-N-acetylglucosamine 2-epimerase